MTVLNITDNKDNIVFMRLKTGMVVIELLPELAPIRVERMKELVHKSFYDGLIFHRAVKDFVVQTGDPTGTGTSGSGQKYDSEISGAHHVRGMVSMANRGPGTEDSQFFITLKDSLHLDDKHTIFGRVVNGMELVDKINGGGSYSGHPASGYGYDEMIFLKLATDLPASILNIKIEDTGPSPEEYLPFVESIPENHTDHGSFFGFLSHYLYD